MVVLPRRIEPPVNEHFPNPRATAFEASIALFLWDILALDWQKRVTDDSIPPENIVVLLKPSDSINDYIDAALHTKVEPDTRPPPGSGSPHDFPSFLSPEVAPSVMYPEHQLFQAIMGMSEGTSVMKMLTGDFYGHAVTKLFVFEHRSVASRRRSYGIVFVIGKPDWNGG